VKSKRRVPTAHVAHRHAWCLGYRLTDGQARESASWLRPGMAIEEWLRRCEERWSSEMRFTRRLVEPSDAP